MCEPVGRRPAAPEAAVGEAVLERAQPLGLADRTTLCQQMRKEIGRHDGSMALDRLAATLAQTFGVSPVSVAVYARVSGQFVLDEDGSVTCASGEPAPPPSEPLELTCGCVRLPGGWALRRRVDREMLRGSGKSMPVAFANELGLRPRATRRLESPFGTIRCAWPGPLPHTGSLRAAANKLNASEGDDLFVLHTDRDTLDLMLMRQAEWNAATGWARLALRCGRRAGDDPMREVALAIGLDPTRDGLEAAIQARLRKRRESKLFTALERAPLR